MGLNVVITGANRGIGLSLSKYYNELGHNVYGICRTSSSELKNVTHSIIDGIDIGDDKSCAKLFEKLSGVKIDILINNAGILFNETLDNLNFNTIEKQFQINAIGALRVTEGLLANYSPDSKIALITSRMGSIGDNEGGNYYGYRMSKAALNAAGKSLAIDLKPKGIAVGLFHPGYVTTEMTGGNGDIPPEEAAKKLIGLIERLNISNSGSFWHSNGEVLPW